MSSDIRRIVWNTRERLTTDDLNNSAALQHRALIELAHAAAAGDTQRYGVIRGLQVSIAGGSMLATVSPGLAMIAGSAPTTYDSDIEFIELTDAASVDLTALVDGANPRWVVIEISASDAVESSENRDIFSPSTGTFSSSSIDKVRGSSPVLRAVGGTPAAAPGPHLPAGSAGWIPLGYVYLGAAAASLTAGDDIGCRPMLRSPGNVDRWAGDSLTQINGGGVTVSADGTTITLLGCSGHFLSSHIPFSIVSANLSVAIGAAYDGGAVPGATGPVYFYAIPAPYPAGYDGTLAPREFVPGSNMDTRFTALAMERMSGCVVIASTTGPNVNTIQGAPTSGNFSITAAPWGGAASVARSTAVYLGAASYNTGGANFRAQSSRAGLVYPTTSIGPNINMNALVSPQSIWGVAGGDFFFPTTALEVLTGVQHETTTGNNSRLTITDELLATYQNEQEAIAVTLTDQHRPIMAPNATTGNVTYAVAGTANAAFLHSLAYRDAILCRR